MLITNCDLNYKPVAG